MVRYREAGLGPSDEELVRYTSSLSRDAEILDEVILVTIAHVLHLAEKEYVKEEQAARIARELARILSEEEFKRALLLSEASYEDVFEALEDYLEKRLGRDSLYLSLGRSRNDHVAAAIRLKVARELAESAVTVGSSAKELLVLAEGHFLTPFVFHTHSMPAQLTSFSHYVLAFVEELLDACDLILNDAFFSLRSPLGSCAGGGTSVELSRGRLAELLGFGGLVTSTLYATGTRNFLARALFAHALIGTAISRLVNDLSILAHPAVGVVKPPARHVQTSSIMPQKKNLATLEVARARVKRAMSYLQYLLSVESGIPLGYSLDLQEVTEFAWRGIRDVREALKVLTDFLLGVEVDAEKAWSLALRGGVLATEAAEALATRLGVPYREAHSLIASALKESGWSLEEALEKLRELGLRPEEVLDPVRVLESRKVTGSPSSNEMKRLVKELGGRAEGCVNEARRILSTLEEARKALLKAATGGEGP